MILPAPTEFLRLWTACILAFLTFVPALSAQDRTPGSLLVFAEVDGRSGFDCYLTVTNTSLNRFITARYTYVSGVDCSQSVVDEVLTPKDTITVLTGSHGPQNLRGYVYVTAVDSSSNPVTENHLVGSSFLVDGFSSTARSSDAFSFRGIPSESSLTDLNSNGRLDLDGLEYASAPAQVLLPRFLADNGTGGGTRLVLLALSGSPSAVVNVDLDIFNDNEEALSAQHSFTCWEQTSLTSISGVFFDSFLTNFTNHDPSEPLGLPGLETGWLVLEGISWTDRNGTFADPVILAQSIELSSQGDSTELPFLEGERLGGSLGPSILKVVQQTGGK